MDQLEAGGVLETVERPARDVTAPERDVETAQCGFRIDALQVVALAESAWSPLPMAVWLSRWPRVMAPSESRRLAMVAMKRRSPSRPWRRGGTAAPRPGGSCGCGPAPGSPGRRASPAPAGNGCADRCWRMKDRRGSCARCRRPSRTPGCASRDHEGGGLGEIGGGRPAAKRQALAARIGESQHPARPARHLGDRLVPETLHDLVECRGHRRERGEASRSARRVWRPLPGRARDCRHRRTPAARTGCRPRR